MKNPNKHIRKTYVDALASATSLPVYGNGIPKDKVLPDKYILLTTQTKNPFARDKENFEWLCSINIELYSVNEKGYNSSLKVDDIEEIVLTTISNGITVSGFNTKFVRFVDSVSLPIETPTNTINRIIVIYEHWLNNAA